MKSPCLLGSPPADPRPSDLSAGTDAARVPRRVAPWPYVQYVQGVARRGGAAAPHRAAGSAPPGAATPRTPSPSRFSPPPTSHPINHVGSGPPTYDAEPTALPPADPDDLDDLVADTVLDGARYGADTLRAASVRGDSARFRGESSTGTRLLTARFGAGEHALVLVAMATGARATPSTGRRPRRAGGSGAPWAAATRGWPRT